MILIVGANGFFGTQLQKLFLKKKIKFFASDISLKENNYLDIRNKNSIKDIIKKNNINIIINCSCEPATSKSKNKLWSTVTRFTDQTGQKRTEYQPTACFSFFFSFSRSTARSWTVFEQCCQSRTAVKPRCITTSSSLPLPRMTMISHRIRRGNLKYCP